MDLVTRISHVKSEILDTILHGTLPTLKYSGIVGFDPMWVVIGS